MNAIKLRAQKVKDQSNLQKIAEGWKTYTVDKNFGVFFGEHMEFVHRLSGGGPGWESQEKCIINDPYVYISPNDKYASKIVKEEINGPGGNEAAYFGTYTGGRNDIANETAISFSYCLISGLSVSVPLGQYTRSFFPRPQGKWQMAFQVWSLRR
ncbi:MAG: hypothetical protein LBR92_04285 [Puniceicoccales bacterium]|jgi:hypothetical protein|nr:hypothetical protein [Puniceicoccales bacterium]